MKRSLFAYLVVPLLALATGIFVMNYRAGLAEKEAREFCAAIQPGAAVNDVIRQALRAGYAVNDAGEAADTMLLSRTVYTTERELFGCLVRRDTAGRVVDARPEHRVVPD